MTPLSLYQADLLKPTFFSDDAQLQAITMLQRLYDDLLVQQNKPVKRNSFLQRMFKSSNSVKTPIKGLYFYGGVGRGKTYLVDLFFHSIKSERKQRLHFHHFMLEVHKQLTILQGQSDPLQKIAKQFASETDIICFDEFFVEDITDAMILAGMFEALFAEGVVLVATSNIHPDHLYKNGLQRARFLPAIDLINEHCEIFNLDGGKDYRLGKLTEAEIYHYPLDEKAKSQIKGAFETLATGEKFYSQKITINNRPLTSIATSLDTLSIEFTALCDGPRSVHDYIELAILYRTVLVANIPQMNDQHNDLTRRFIAMVDEFYDRNVVLIISAEVDILSLYQGSRLSFEFQRCVSRLLEMQSKAYLSKAHHFAL
ncbi:cell division protein ZapE [Psychromonas sp. RZ22]|uniref:cell division protein ZapE n=1 Tax=Psychromonas algarum TaxID=2555643 RepID=UPI001067A50B|nr:cell division protein ZapE [Psychromonas sp. RZ22]TEW56649.1 cell division protein ZapE [Psychromonas sp. RZ22]